LARRQKNSERAVNLNYDVCSRGCREYDDGSGDYRPCDNAVESWIVDDKRTGESHIRWKVSKSCPMYMEHLLKDEEKCTE